METVHKNITFLSLIFDDSDDLFEIFGNILSFLVS